MRNFNSQQFHPQFVLLILQFEFLILPFLIHLHVITQLLHPQLVLLIFPFLFHLHVFDFHSKFFVDACCSSGSSEGSCWCFGSFSGECRGWLNNGVGRGSGYDWGRSSK
ncbi:hypothetical protein TNCV_2291861 [Trichonephila clavipes]|uniref:Uncharacterized protein n=1 Tax=Trichonephila clavipes TaxID=2585209 RepID=A0A8X6V210_TRICX|nr:hypothetical protein TNCV_2291861 [Trichonephila clavipes]